MEIKVLIHRGISYSLIGILIPCIFASLIFLLGNLFEELFNPVSLAITIFTIFTVAAAFQPVLSKLQHIVGRRFLSDRDDELQALERFAIEMGDNIDIKQLTSSLVTAIAHAMQSRGVYLLLPSYPTDSFEIYTYYGEKSKGRLSFSTTSKLMLTMRYQDSVIDSNTREVLNVLGNSEMDALEMNRIELLVPLKTEQQLVGVLLIGDKLSGEPHSTEDRRLLHRIMSEIARSIENAHLLEGVQKSHAELKEAAGGVIHAMLSAIETRDPYTAEHQQRVANLACEIARALGLAEWDIEGLRIMGLLHDIGKLNVPAEILSKSGRLNQYEFNIIKNHPRVGYEILSEIEFPWPVTQAILQHHERLDGSGYPEGLAGTSITREARILGVADVVEAMSSHRPYRPALGSDRALEEISQNRGILYDPEIVDACSRLLQKHEVERLLQKR
ncbi:HD domain-containing phosphohydrolase [Chloroflexota bacterium]